MAVNYKSIIACYPSVKQHDLMVALAKEENVSLSRLMQNIIYDKINSLSPERLERLEKSKKTLTH